MTVYRYIILDGKKYTTTGRAARKTTKKAQQIKVTLGKKTASQLFGFASGYWDISILVYLSSPATGYGSRDDLIAAHAKDYVSFTDNFGNTANVFTPKDLPEPFEWATVKEDVPYTVKIQLRERII